VSNIQKDVAAGIIECIFPKEGELEAVFVFPAEGSVFAGHFPGRPIVPGILELEMVRAAMQRLWVGVDRRIVSIEKAKFLRIVKPGEEIRLVVHYSASLDQKRWVVKGVSRVKDEKAAHVEMTLGSNE
jgi:3-hydroxyacyl-[acyl-carrier-protein] dehydratase